MGFIQTIANCPGCCSADEASITLVEKTLSQYHRQQLDLCYSLEEVASALPDGIDGQKMLGLSKAIFPMIKRSHEFEEQVLFPLFELRETRCIMLRTSLERLRFEHWEDESYAFEVSEGLADHVSRPEKRNAEALGYMLRGFFEGIRRHIAFEQEHIVPRLRSCALEFPDMPSQVSNAEYEWKTTCH